MGPKGRCNVFKTGVGIVACSFEILVAVARLFPIEDPGNSGKIADVLSRGSGRPFVL